MKGGVQLQVLIAVLTAGLMFSSCGNVDIVKRRYRPGFHVDISKKKQKSRQLELASVQEADPTHDQASTVKETPQSATDATDGPLLTASTATTPEVQYTTNREKRNNLRKEFHSPDFKGLSFERKMKRIEHELLKPTSAASVEWMKWVSFGTGIGSLAFGATALLLAFLTGVTFVSTAAWPFIVFALLLAGAAITFSIIYKKNNGTDSKARLGMIFGIIGGGLALLAIIIWTVFFALFVL